MTQNYEPFLMMRTLENSSQIEKSIHWAVDCCNCISWNCSNELILKCLNHCWIKSTENCDKGVCIEITISIDQTVDIDSLNDAH